MAAVYDNVVRVLMKPPSERLGKNLGDMIAWFKKRSKLFGAMTSDKLMDLFKHCEFKTVKKHAVIVRQGEKGSIFYIILRGNVSVLLRETPEDPEAEEEMAFQNISSVKNHADRVKLGLCVGELTNGESFGELALISPDCIRSASCVADDLTDLILVHKDLYERSVSSVVSGDFQRRLSFVEENMLFSSWPNKWRKYVAAGMTTVNHAYGDIMVRQGAQSELLYFVMSGEVSLVVDPSTHEKQYSDFKDKCAALVEDETESPLKNRQFTLVNWLNAKSRVRERLKSAQTQGADDNERTLSEDLPEYKLVLRPSDLRKKTARETRKKAITTCFISKGNIFGDIEFILNLDTYHCSAVCSQPTVTLVLHRAIFDRMFRKKNPITIKIMARQLLHQIPKRYSRTGVINEIPLMKYFIAKIREENGLAVKGQRDESLPRVADSSSTSSLESRAKSGISARSFPMTRRNEVRMRSRSPPPLTSSSYQGLPPATPRNVRFFDDESEWFDGSSQDGGSGDEAGRQSADPGKGIFLKLLKISNPMVSRKMLSMPAEEYTYLTQLRRRLATKIEDFYPTPIVPASDLPGDGRRQTRLCEASARGRRRRPVGSGFPSVRGAAPGMSRRTGRRGSPNSGRPLTRSNTLSYSLP